MQRFGRNEDFGTEHAAEGVREEDAVLGDGTEGAPFAVRGRVGVDLKAVEAGERRVGEVGKSRRAFVVVVDVGEADGAKRGGLSRMEKGG